ncbi:MAG TPA: glycosyltransferase family 87 protein [Gemmatimonadaceae bacterium]|nr:glycosyltransferase family 87 protein [Gemmatimonadaceae bacterium]
MSRFWQRGWSDDRRVQRAALVVGGILVLVFLIQTIGKAYRPQGNDFTTYLLSARALAAGQSPYETVAVFPYIYPMFPAMAFIPLAFAPYWLANVVWYAGNVGALVWSMRLALGLRGRIGATVRERRLLAPLILLALLFLTPIQNHLLNGQINFVVLLLCLLFARAAREGRVMPAALFLATAIATKLVPLIFAPYLLLRRRFGVLAAALAGATLLSFAPVVFLGQSIVPIYRDYLSRLAAHNERGALNAETVYYSLDGAVREVVATIASGPSVALRLAAAAAVMLPLLIIDLRLRRGGTQADRWASALYLVAILLIAPVSETHHLVFLFPAIVLLAIPLLLAPREARAGEWVIAVGIYGLLLAARWDPAGPWAFAGIVALYGTMLARAHRLPLHEEITEAEPSVDSPVAPARA